jgi:hypothetical protein
MPISWLRIFSASASKSSRMRTATPWFSRTTPSSRCSVPTSLWLSARASSTLLAAAGAGEHPDDLVADLLRVGVEVEQDARGHALVLPNETEQDVLRPDVVVAERERLAKGELEDLLRARGEGDLPRRDLVALAHDACDLGAHLLDGDVEALEHAGGETLFLTEQPQQDVLRPDVVVLQRACFVLRENDDLACPLGKAFEQTKNPLCPIPEPIVADCSGGTEHPSEWRYFPVSDARHLS